MSKRIFFKSVHICRSCD